MRGRCSIELQHVGFMRDGRDVLRDVSLTIGRGELTALVGLNGAGKTTLISLLSTLAVPSRGRVVVNGIDTARDAAKVRASIGVVFQESALEPRLSTHENLSFIARCQGLNGRAAGLRVDALLEALGLDALAQTRVGSLSGGQRRRVELARALVAKPPVLLLDEPTLGLDAAARQAFWSEIKTLAGAGHTVLCSTHDTDEARDADSVVILDQGELLARGPWQALSASTPGSVRLHTRYIDETHRWLLEHGYRAQACGDVVSVIGTDPQAMLPALLQRIPYAVQVAQVAMPDLRATLANWIDSRRKGAVGKTERVAA
ncbi:ABC transporter ATP-binding protein [Trinickia dabaoshanensis]|uniref:ABC transporter ATP-binding protein n=2 Tax=Trinickia dabaoshanensis TaxID=564714 RepID=A0A2N7VLB4_9BURK|nr:ABC transporter ATP-binding protein [Trinickia dabaoshanensis]